MTTFLSLVTFQTLPAAATLAVVLGTAADPERLVDRGARPVCTTSPETLRTELLRAAGTDRRFYVRATDGSFHHVERLG